MLAHYHENIEGWFDYQDIFKEAVENAKDGDVFVEIGAWLGKSTSYLAVEIKNSKKDIKYYVIDTWEGAPEQKQDVANFETTGITLYDRFLKNMEAVRDHIEIVRKSSVEASHDFSDGSVDFLFLDASHYYADVKADIYAWKSKVKKGCYFAGHDYDFENAWPDVKRAVDEEFGEENVIRCPPKSFKVVM